MEPRSAFRRLLRLIFERTLLWLGENRRLSKYYKQHCVSEEDLIYVVNTHFIAKRPSIASYYFIQFLISTCLICEYHFRETFKS
jgi:hypothetical protein